MDISAKLVFFDTQAKPYTSPNPWVSFHFFHSNSIPLRTKTSGLDDSPPLILDLWGGVGKQGGSSWIQGQPGLLSWFQSSLGYIVRLFQNQHTETQLVVTLWLRALAVLTECVQFPAPTSGIRNWRVSLVQELTPTGLYRHLHTCCAYTCPQVYTYPWNK